jgi:hypothetical protein
MSPTELRSMACQGGRAATIQIQQGRHQPRVSSTWHIVYFNLSPALVNAHDPIQTKHVHLFCPHQLPHGSIVHSKQAGRQTPTNQADISRSRARIAERNKPARVRSDGAHLQRTQGHGRSDRLCWRAPPFAPCSSFMAPRRRQQPHWGSARCPAHMLALQGRR